MLFHGFILRFRHDFHALSAIKRLLKQLRIVSAALVQNVRILIRYHCRLCMTGIPLHRLNIAAIQLEFVGDAGVPQTMEADLRKRVCLNQLPHTLADDVRFHRLTTASRDDEVVVVVLCTQLLN